MAGGASVIVDRKVTVTLDPDTGQAITVIQYVGRKGLQWLYGTQVQEPFVAETGPDSAMVADADTAMLATFDAA